MKTEKDIVASLCKTFLICLGVILVVSLGVILFWWAGEI